MKFYKLVRNLLNEEENIEFYYPSEEEKENRDKYLSDKKFIEWFKYNKHKLKKVEIIDKETGKKIIAYNSNYDINISHFNLLEIPIKFNEINNNFNCSFNQLKSLKNCPEIVNGDFYCNNNQLKLIDYYPTKVNGFYCYDNQLESLKNIQKINIITNIDCSFNLLDTLEYLPKKINGYLKFKRNLIQTFKNGPKIIEKSIICSENQLISLIDCPYSFKDNNNKVINGDFYCDHNKLESFEGCPEIIKGNFNCSYNLFKSLDYCPKEVFGDFISFGNNFTERDIKLKCKVHGIILL